MRPRNPLPKPKPEPRPLAVIEAALVAAHAKLNDARKANAVRDSEQTRWDVEYAELYVDGLLDEWRQTRGTR